MSEERSSGTYIIDSEYNVLTFNDTIKEMYPQLKQHEKCYRSLMNRDTPL